MSDPRGVSVRVRELEVLYPGTRVPVLRGLDLDVHAGGTLAVVGESGSGKSVLVRAILGLAPVSRGHVLLGDTDLTRASGTCLRVARRRIGTVFQSPVDSLDPRWPAQRSVAEALSLRTGRAIRDLMDAADELLEAVGIPAGRRGALPGALSGGECQRVAIARAVAGGPDLVLADEPTAMLDPGVAARILDLLAALQRSMGFTLVLITHHLTELQRLPGALLVLCAGHPAERNISSAAPPAHPFSRYLWDAAVRPVEPVNLADEGCPFSPGCPRVVDLCRQRYPDPEEVGDGWTIWCNNPEI
ncbi:MAG: ATP-binding cassette domain-containing protein [Pseudomonadota bacterium]